MASIRDVGEDTLIGMFAPRLPSVAAAVIGPGDDAAVLALDGDLVASSDALVQDRHFRLDWSTAADVGFRAAMQNLADIDAMGAVPLGLQVMLAVPASTDVDWVLGLADGLREACEPLGVGVVGGDLVDADAVSVAVTALGETRGVTPVRRSGARPGDRLAVSGPLGAAAAGLRHLESGRRPGDGHPSEEAIGLFLRPRPRIGAGVEAARAGATAMMDVSDGLLRDLARLARASGVVVRVASALVPAHPGAAAAAEDGQQLLAWTLTGGEDHHLVAAFPQRAALPDGWVEVGVCAEGDPGVLVDGDQPLAWGWDHFARP